MRNMLSNPAVIDQIIDSSPELRNMGPGVRQIMQSEQFRNMLSNPQQMAQMARQAEQMRNNPMFAQMMGNMGAGGGGFGGLGGFGQGGGAGGAGATDPWGAPLGGGAGAAGGADTQQQNRGPVNLFNPSAGQQQQQQGGGADTAGAGGLGGFGGFGAGQGQGQMPDFAALQQMMNAFGGGAGGAGAGGFGGFGSPPPAASQQAAQPHDTRSPEERFAPQLQQLTEMGFVNGQANVRALLATGGNVQASIEYLLSQQTW